MFHLPLTPQLPPQTSPHTPSLPTFLHKHTPPPHTPPLPTLRGVFVKESGDWRGVRGRGVFVKESVPLTSLHSPLFSTTPPTHTPSHPLQTSPSTFPIPSPNASPPLPLSFPPSSLPPSLGFQSSGWCSVPPPSSAVRPSTDAPWHPLLSACIFLRWLH